MHKDDAIKIVHDRLQKLGVPKHVSSVRKIPSFVEVQILIDGDMRRLRLRSGITHYELEQHLADLEARWRLAEQGHQITLEEAIDEAKRDA